MAITMDKAAKQRRLALRGGRVEGAAELEQLMVAGLGKQLKRLYDLLDDEVNTSSADLRDKMGMEANHLGALLGRLRRWGLAERTDGEDRISLWRKTGNGTSMEAVRGRTVSGNN